MSSMTIHDAVLFALSKKVTLPLLLSLIYKIFTDPSTAKSISSEVPAQNEKEQDPTPEITPVNASFDWSTTQPFKYRPFKKGEYKLVMGIHTIPADEWLFVENTYKQYTDLKWSYVSDPYIADHTIFMTPDCEPATIEFYEKVTQFMLKRYPSCFEIRGDQIYNKIRDDTIPLDPYSVPNKKDLHKHLARFMEEDYIILFPDPEHYDTDEYIFKGGVFAFAAGFDPVERFQTPMTTIHGPVPEYKTKLRPQMNKFFEKLKPGTFVRRNNWSVQTHNKVLVMNANKGKEDEEIGSLKADDLDFEREVFFRSERQTLTKLPKSGAIVFGIRTYLTPMKEIRDEGLGDELIGGIEGMQDNIGHYKRRPEWGEAVCDFLRGDSDGCQKPEIKGLE